MPVAAFVIVSAALVAMPAAANHDSELIVDEVGSGLTQIELASCVAENGGEAKQFRGERGLLCITHSPAVTQTEIEIAVNGFRHPDGIDFSIGDVDPSVAQILDAETDNPVYVVVFGAGDYHYSILFIQSLDDPEFDAQAFVTELAHRHLALFVSPGREAESTSGSSEMVDDDLADLLVDLDWLKRLGDPIAGVHRNGDIVAIDDLTNAFVDGTSSILQFYETPDGQILGVFIGRYKFPLFAAAALGDDSLAEDRSSSFHRLDRRPNLAMVRDGSAEPPGAAFRQGRYLYLVLPPSSASDLELTTNRVGALAAALYDAGPGGDTDPFTFASISQAVAQTALLTIALGLGVMTVRVVTGRPARRTSYPSATPPNLIDVAAGAAAIRRRSRLLVVVRLAGLAVLVVTLAVFSGPFGFAVAAAALLLSLGAGPWIRRADRPGRVERMMPNSRGLIFGVVALLVLVVGLGLLIRGAGTWLFTPWFGHLELADRLDTDPGDLSRLMIALGLGMTITGSWLSRYARRVGRASADRLTRVDERPPLLYLRSFDDDLLPIPAAATSRRPFFEVFSVLGREPFEETVAWQLGQYGPIIAVGKPDETEPTFGAAKERFADDTWQRSVIDRMDQAQCIVVVVGRSEGLAWEVDQIVTRGHLGKSLFVVPPVADHEIQARWDAVSVRISAAGEQVDSSLDPTSALVIAPCANGRSLSFTATRRDEAGYRAALDAATAALDETRTPVGVA